MSTLEARLIQNRNNNQRNLTVFLNSGDPNLETTVELIQVCGDNGVDVIELGVPFANSFTDGETLIRSHERAIANGVTFETVIEMLEGLKGKCKASIVLLVDFSYTVKERGVQYVVEKAAAAGAEGILMHGLPPLFIEDYVKQATAHNIAPIFSLYPQSNPEKMAETLARAKGFIYLVSVYGRTGNAIDFLDPKIRSFYANVRKSTNVPLMAGFGVRNVEDISKIFTASELDGVIMGSQIAKLIEQNISPDSASQREKIIGEVKAYVTELATTKSIQTDKNKIMELEHVHTA